MFEIVRTNKQLKEFKKTWERVCKQQKWFNDPYSYNGVRYNVVTKAPLSPIFPIISKKVIGTVEFIPYDPGNPNSTVEGPERFEFSKVPLIQAYQDRTWEVDKLCLDETFQRRGHLDHFISIFSHHIETYHPRFYLGLMEKKFFRMVRINFGISVLQMGEELKGPKSSLIPVLFEVNEFLKIIEKVSNK